MEPLKEITFETTDSIDNSILSISSEIVSSIKIILKKENELIQNTFNINDIISVKYVEDGKIKNITGKLKKFNIETICLDYSSEFNSNIELINIKDIRKIELYSLE